MNSTLNKDRDYEEKMIDALFRHAAEVAEEELLDEATDETPVEFSARHEKNMDAFFKSVTPEKPRLIRPKRIIVLVAALLVLFALGTVAFKPTILNFFLKTGETNTEIRFGEEEPVGDTYATEGVTFGYIPEGMQMVENSRGTTNISMKFQENELFFQLRVKKDNLVAFSDNEKSSTEEIIINGNPAYFLNKDGRINIKWHTEKATYTLLGNLEKTELIKIAENIK